MIVFGIEFTQVIAANPGFYVLTSLDTDSGYPVDFDKAPVFAWALERVTLTPYPITIEGLQTTNDYILNPDGTVEKMCHDKALSVGELLERLQSEYVAKHGTAGIPEYAPKIAPCGWPQVAPAPAAGDAAGIVAP